MDAPHQDYKGNASEAYIGILKDSYQNIASTHLNLGVTDTVKPKHGHGVSLADACKADETSSERCASEGRKVVIG